MISMVMKKHMYKLSTSCCSWVRGNVKNAIKKKSKFRTQSDLGSASFSDLAPIWLKTGGDVRYSMRTDKMRL